MTRGGNGRPVPIDALRAVAQGYVFGDSRQQIADALGITTGMLHNRLQQIRERTGKRSNHDACIELLRAPERYAIEPTKQITPEKIAWRAAMRRSGYNDAEIARNEGVTRQAIAAHFRRHEP